MTAYLTYLAAILASVGLVTGIKPPPCRRRLLLVPLMVLGPPALVAAGYVAFAAYGITQPQALAAALPLVLGRMAAFLVNGAGPALGLDLAGQAMPVVSGLGAVFLVLYAVIRTGWVAALRLAARMGHLEPASGPAPVILSATAARWAMGWGLLLVALLPVTPEFLPPGMVGGLVPLFWAVSLAAGAEVAGLGERPRPVTRPSGTVDGTDVTPVPEDDLLPLYTTYFHDHRNMLLYWPQESVVRRLPHDGLGRDETPAVVTEDSDRPLTQRVRNRIETQLPKDRVEDVLRAVRRYEDGANLLFAESLSHVLFLLFTEIMQHHHDRGDLTLLLCPADAVETVKQAFENQTDQHFLRITERWAVVGETHLAPDSQVNFIICSEARLSGDILDRAQDLAPLLRRIRLLICLDLQATEGSLLRLSLARLWQALDGVGNEHGARPRVICQTAPYRKPEPLARSVLGGQYEEEHINPHVGSRRYVLVWDDTVDNAGQLAEGYFCETGQGSDVIHQGAIDMALTLRIPAWQASHRRQVTLLDREQVFDQDQNETIHDLLANFGYDEEVLLMAGQARPSDFAVAVEDDGVTLVLEAANLPLALKHNYNFGARPESLLHVVSRDYPLRAYHLACIIGAGASHNVPTWLLPWAPHPIGGLSEMAWSLYQTLLNGKAGLTRQQITEHFFALAPAGLLDELGVTANFVGLRDLFSRVISPPPDLRKHRDEDSKQDRYTVQPSDTPLPIQGFIPAVDEHEQPINAVAMVAADHGLSFAVGINILVARKNYRVIEVRPDQFVKLQMTDSDDKTGHLERRFIRAYRPFFIDADLRASTDRVVERRCKPFVEGESLEVGRHESWLRVRHLHACFERRSLGVVAHRRGERPFIEGAANYAEYRFDSPIGALRLFQNVCHVAIRHERDATPPGPAAVATLCVVLNDMMASMFPTHAHRIAVVSPQAARWGHEDEAAHYTGRAYPSLEPAMRVDAGELSSVDLFIIEDSDHDLGVVRVLVRDRDAFLAVARDYVRWLARRLQAGEEAGLFNAQGAGQVPAGFDLMGALEILEALPLPRSVVPKVQDSYDFQPDLAFGPATDHCHFCGRRVGRRHRLPDGRLRCAVCSKESVDTLDAFKLLLDETIDGMESRYGIAIDRSVSIRFATATEIAVARGLTAADLVARAVGVVIQRSDGYLDMLVENGAPRSQSIATLAHELTHVWQFRRGPMPPLEMAEGHAAAVEVDYLRHRGLMRAANWLEADYLRRDDVYGRGFRALRQRVPPGNGPALFDLVDTMPLEDA